MPRGRGTRDAPDDRASHVPRLRIFLAEDDPELRHMMALTLRRAGHMVVESEDGRCLMRDLGRAFWQSGADHTRALIITDIRMPGRDGLSVLNEIRHYEWCPAFLVVTGFADPVTRDQARSLGALAVLDKPFDLEELRSTVEHHARRVATQL